MNKVEHEFPNNNIKNLMEKSPIVKVVKKVIPAVVSIVISKTQHQLEEEIRRFLPFFGVPFGLEPPIHEEIPPELLDERGRIKIGGGSGFIISDDGIILTNRHVVIDPKAEYTVITNDGKKYSAKVLARDSINDVAILTINAKKLPTVELGNSSALELGETVIAIGTALGLFQNTVSTGVVSGLSRLITAETGLGGEIERLRGLIQTDAAINPGNSGGPLVNMAGKAIGINTAVVFGAQNIGFAIPINTAKKDMADVKKYGHLRQPSLGLRYLILNKSLQRKFNLPSDYGALIVRERPDDVAILAGGAADKAGLKEYDIVLECDGKKITPDNTLQDVIQNKNIGDAVKLKILRKGKEIAMKATLGERQ